MTQGMSRGFLETITVIDGDDTIYSSSGYCPICMREDGCPHSKWCPILLSDEELNTTNES